MACWEQTDVEDARAGAFHALADVLQLVGKEDEARVALERALAIETELGWTLPADRTRAAIAALDAA